MRRLALRPAVATLFARIAGGLCIAVGAGAWIRVAWIALADLDGVTATGEQGGRLVGWGLAGSVVMILGMIVLHFGQDAAERGARDEPTTPR